MGVHAGTAAEALVATARVAKVRPYSVPGADAGAMVSDVLSAKIGAAVLWAPLAGLSALERDPDNRLAFRTVGGPQPPPSPSEVSKGAETKCAEEIKSLLEAYGVVPAENTVQIAIRPLLHQRVPAADPVAAEAGRAIFAARCARCHGEQVVAARDALAPVDLIRSVRRFTFPGFLYIVLNGRSQKGHPGFRGTLEEQEIARSTSTSAPAAAEIWTSQRRQHPPVRSVHCGLRRSRSWWPRRWPCGRCPARAPPSEWGPSRAR
jgi:mono/diheme cytochrome c family protein